MIRRRLKKYSDTLRQSLIYDNGSENVCYETINAVLGAKSFFSAPYHSRKKGSVEQVNVLIRRFLSKGTNFSMTRTAIDLIEKLLNHRTQKYLDYRTLYEVFREISWCTSSLNVVAITLLHHFL
ncbi:MAG: hypothetical protein NPIRA02_27210 [Nitrospirales bacterium]|nr:MAG: hypothetical protein NPIRA02_27210 [Nitrospirales bacterium]